MATWKILRGILQDPAAKLVRHREEPDAKDGTKGVRLAEEGYFIPGDVFRTDRDLGSRNRSGYTKYEKLDDIPATEDAKQIIENLEDLTVAKLRKHAKEQGIDLETAITREEIVNTIRAALQEA